METKVIDIRPRDELTYYPFTDTMWNSTRGKIAAIKVWREFHKLAPVAWDKHGAPVVPSLRSAKTVVEEAAHGRDDLRAQHRHPLSIVVGYQVEVALAKP